jgi:ribosomal protein S18 acetylase RimI-like enzyme
MAKEKVDHDLIVIAPLEKKMSKGAFLNEDEEFKHLINWFKTAALLSQREKKCKVYVAQLGAKTVGYISISSHRFQVLLIGKLYVDPDYQGQGIGKKLMNIALDIAQNIDDMIGCIGLLVDANSNEKTVRFYSNFGFEIIDKDATERTTKMFFRISEEAVV